MLQLPADDEGLAWIDSHEPGKLLLVPGVQAVSITAAAAGDEQALAFLRFTAQHFAGSPALHSLSAEEAFHRAACPEHTTSLQRQLELDAHIKLTQVYGKRLSHTHNLLQQAVREGRLASLQWLLGFCHPTPARAHGLMQLAAAEGRLDIMKQLVTGPFPARPSATLTWIATDHPPCLRWLLEGYKDYALQEGLLVDLAGRGDLDTLTWLWDNDRVHQSRWDTDVTSAAAASGNLALLSWLRQLSPPCPWDEECTEAAATKGNLAMLQWLRSQSPACPWHWIQCFTVAARSGNIDLLEWLQSKRLGTPWDTRPTTAAIRTGSLSVLTWLDAQGCPILGETAWLTAAAHGCNNILQWLHMRKIRWGDQMIECSASQAAVPTLMFLGDIGCPLELHTQELLLIARKSLCTFYGLLRWCRRAVSDPSRMTQLAFDHTCLDCSGQRLLVHLSRLPQELAVLIATKANLQHDMIV